MGVDDGVLAKGVVELGLDDIKLRDELPGTLRRVSDGLASAMKATKVAADTTERMYKVTGDLAYLNINNVKLKDAEARSTIKLAYAQEKYASAARKVYAMSLKERQEARGGKSIAETMPGYGDNGTHANYGSMIGKTVGMVGAAAGAASGMAFAGAAMAGSTTFDTLTGSLKMLSLAAGTKTQAPVLGVARAIQLLAKSAENAPNGMIGAMGGASAGAAIGARMGGLPGALAGGIIGGATGGSVDKIANDFADKRNMVNRIKADPNEVAKLLTEIHDLEAPWYSSIPFVGNSTEIAKRRGAIRTAEARNRIKNEDDDFKTAGLGMPGSFSGLADMRQQAQLSVFSQGGELGQANLVKELQNNQKALEKNSAILEKSNPNFVGPPAP